MADIVVNVFDVIVNEAQGYAEFVINLSAPSAQTVSLGYFASAGSATAGTDFASIGNQLLSFAPGETLKTVRVALYDDSTVEGTESFYLGLYSPVNGLIGKSLATATIIDDDAAAGTPVIAISDAVVDEKAGRAVFTLTLDKPSTTAVSVNVATSDGSATAGIDYQALAAQPVAFAPGEMVRTVVVNLIDDATTEPGEYFSLMLSNPVGATLPDSQAIAYIGSSDASSVIAPTISVADVVVNEAQGYAEFVINLSAPSAQTVSLGYFASAGSATAGTDFASIGNQLLSFAPGETLKTVRVALYDDSTVEGTESFYLNLYSATNATISDAQGVATILDNDGAALPTLSVNDITVNEETGAATFTVSINAASAQTVTVLYSTLIGTANANGPGTDYQGVVNQTLSFSPGQTNQSVTINLVNDTVPEGTEYFDLLLENPTNATVVDSTGRATITDTDTAALPSLSVNDITVNENTGTATFTVSLSAPSAQTVSLRYSTLIGTANANGPDTDYVGQVDQSLNFTPGQTSRSVTINLVNNSVAEPTEYFDLLLESPTNATIVDSTGRATIIDNDRPATSALSISPTSAVKDEGDGGTTPFTFTVTRGGDTTGSTTVNWAVGASENPTSTIPAATQSDFGGTFPSGTVTFGPTDTVKIITVNISGDTHFEGGGLAESFAVSLSNASGEATITTASATGRIKNDDQTQYCSL